MMDINDLRKFSRSFRDDSYFRVIGQNAYSRYYASFFELPEPPWDKLPLPHPPIYPDDSFEEFKKRSDILDTEGNRKLFDEKLRLVHLLQELTARPTEQLVEKHAARLKRACGCLRMAFMALWEDQKASKKEINVCLWKDMLFYNGEQQLFYSEFER